MRAGTAGDLFSMAAACPIPGREERFKALSGRDAPVIDYLNQQESVHQFLASVMSLVDCERDQLPEARIQEPDGLVRLHGRPASVGVLG